MGRKIALVVTMLMLPGTLFLLCAVILARVLARTPRGRELIARTRERLPRWAAAPFALLQKKSFSELENV